MLVTGWGGERKTMKRNSPQLALSPIGRKVDVTLATALTILGVLYALVTISTFVSLPDAPFTPHRGSGLHAASSPNRPSETDGVLNDKNDDDEKMELEKLRRAFPVSVHKNDRNDFETIEHPGARMSFAYRPPPPRHNHNHNAAGGGQDDDVKKNNIPTVKVPPFWDPPHFQTRYGGIRNYLGQYGSRLMTRAEALSIGSFVVDSSSSSSFVELETIYISIASYRDEECANTIESIFSRARYPQRVRVGVVDQIDTSADRSCSEPPHESCEANPDQALCLYSSQIDVYTMEAKLAVGPVFARHVGQRMYRGEYFAAQCDAHVTFVADWDVDIIEQWKSANNEMAILAAYLSDVQGSIDERTGVSLRHTRPIMCRSDYEGVGATKHLRHGQQPEGPPGIRGTPTLEPYWAAGFSFGRGHFVINVPYDQYLPMVFQGEEISIGLRAFTYGYDFYTPERSVCFHMYAVGKNKEKRKRVKLFWENSNAYGGAETTAMMRLNGIIGMSTSSSASKLDPLTRKRGNAVGELIHVEKDYDHTEERRYGTGKVRTVQKFFATFGIHPDTQTVEQHLCQFVGKKMQRVFVPHLRSNGMGINYDEIDYEFVDPEREKK